MLLGAGWPAAAHFLSRTPRPEGTGRADALTLPKDSTSRLTATRHQATPAAAQPVRQADIASVAVARNPVRHSGPGQASPSQASPSQAAAGRSGYLNPLRSVLGLVPERVDQGVDFSGSGPVYALGDGVVTAATAGSSWPGGGWIVYQLTDGPEAGLYVYLAENVTPDVAVGQHVTPDTVIGSMYEGAYGIETGWADSASVDAEASSPEAGSIGAGGPYPTKVGLSFDQVLQSLGVPAAPNYGPGGYGLLPPGYPA